MIKWDEEDNKWTTDDLRMVLKQAYETVGNHIDGDMFTLLSLIRAIDCRLTRIEDKLNAS